MFKALMYALIVLTFINCGHGQSTEIQIGKASEEGMDELKLMALADFIDDNPRISIFSLLISKNGKLVFELYTGQIKQDYSHYLMSVTKSVLSTLIGIAIDQGKITSENTPLSETIPKKLLSTKRQVEAFSKVNLQNVMGMSALHTPDPPRDMSPAARARQDKYLNSSNYLKFLVQQPLLRNIGKDFLYNDETPTLASGILSYTTGLSAFDYGCDTLFKDLNCKNMEWMHSDRTGINMGGYGLRLRPLDMQKIGITILQKGKWQDKQVVSSAWVEKIYQPYISSSGVNSPPNYGWYWWRPNYGFSKPFLEANGWKGQRIAIQPDLGLVVTMTGCLEPERCDEQKVFSDIMSKYVIPAAKGPGTSAPNNSIEEKLQKINNGQARFNKAMENRMIPSVALKEQAVPFKD
jgi:CubicO group peptidase (beta-lactamase class C family)